MLLHEAAEISLPALTLAPPFENSLLAGDDASGVLHDTRILYWPLLRSCAAVVGDDIGIRSGEEVLCVLGEGPRAGEESFDTSGDGLRGWYRLAVVVVVDRDGVDGVWVCTEE